jgi:hypothetical protein
MKITIKNLGALEQAEFELGQMTIICGGNNTGKTYATYALFGFLSYWKEAFYIDISEETIRTLLSEGVVLVDLEEYRRDAKNIVAEACYSYKSQLSKVFASSDKHFSDSDFAVGLDEAEIVPVAEFERSMGTAKTQLFSISKKTTASDVTISLMVDKENIKIPTAVIKRIIGEAIKDIVFGSVFPNPFIASAERTGAAIFRKELNFARNRLLENMSSMDKDINPFELLTRVYADYALPVKTNVDFTRQLEELAKQESFIAKKHPEIIEEFSGIIGGEYTVTRNDELYFVPKGKRIKLTMDESSSAVRSLLDVGFYLRHVVQPGDLFMVDEPELNLHPENQRKIARLFARLVNIGIKVFITTHSDYIIKELNTLIMLNRNGSPIKRIRERYRYRREELLSADQICVYIAEERRMRKTGKQRASACQTLTPADIDPVLGIEARSFDVTIDEMNQIQEAILFSGEEPA